MASPLKPGKQPIVLAPDGTRVSRIRRDPPPVARQTVVPDRDELDRRTVPVGIILFALALVVAIFGLGAWAGWSPSQYTLEVDDSGGL